MVRALQDAGMEFLVVGGLSAVLNGVPVNTFDVGVVHRQRPKMSIASCASSNPWTASTAFNPSAGCVPPDPPCSPPATKTCRPGTVPLDLLGEIGNNLGYDELVPRSTEILIAEGVRVPILNLETLIEVQEALGGEKDRAMLPLLRRTLKQKSIAATPKTSSTEP